MATTQLIDGFGRNFPYLRLSLVEACNFRCSYCLPAGHRAVHAPSFLSVTEIARLVRAFARLGMYKVRLTGGEPSLRKDLDQIISTVAKTSGIRQVAITTNGCRLPRRLPGWHSAGLTALNVSVDSLQRQRFQAIAGQDRLPEILQGIDLAQSLGFSSIKINVVLLRGINDDELPAWIAFIRDRRISVRFIELMQTGENRAYFERHHARANALIARLCDAGWSEGQRAPEAGPAREFFHPDCLGSIGVIAPYSSDFCEGCNRLRVTARGDLRLCLFGDAGLALRPLLASEDTQEALVERIATQLYRKPSGHSLHSRPPEFTPHLASIGG